MNHTMIPAGVVIPQTAPTPERTLAELREAWAGLSLPERLAAFRALPHPDREELFEELPAHDMAELAQALPERERRWLLRTLEPDDLADLVQEIAPEEREAVLQLLDGPSRKEVSALLAYAEDDAGGLMNPRFAAVRPDMGVDEALAYVRRLSRERLETPLTYVYVLDGRGVLVGVLSLRQLFRALPGARVREVMTRTVVSVTEELDQEAVARKVRVSGLLALPVVDAAGRMKGIVTADDVVDVVNEEATEDIQKMGGMAALDLPYLAVRFQDIVKARAGWLAVLLVGEMLTASAMAVFEHQLARATVLALFVPLIISSGGNSGSQASTLVIRAMALGEVRMRDWWRVMRRELAAGLALGATLAVLGFVRVVLWQAAFDAYGPYWLGLAGTVAASLVGVVLFGTITGSMLPFALRRLGLDPASASAPFVATLVDVTGILIYFGVASVLLAQMLA